MSRSGLAGFPESWRIVGGQKALGQNTWLSGMREVLSCTLCAGVTSLPKSGCDLATIDLACLFIFFLNLCISVTLSQSQEWQLS